MPLYVGSGHRGATEIEVPHADNNRSMRRKFACTLCTVRNPVCRNHITYFIIIFRCKLQLVENRLALEPPNRFDHISKRKCEICILSDAKLLLASYFPLALALGTAQRHIANKHWSTVSARLSGRRKSFAPLHLAINGNHWASRARRSNNNNKNNDNQMKHLADEIV